VKEASYSKRNHAIYSTYLLAILKEKGELSWGEAAASLVEEFDWTFKTASNRIHELAQHKVVLVSGSYKKGTFGRINPDNRRISLP